MRKAETLKQEILKQHRSIRQFSMEMGIPYSTLVTALDRGVEGMAYGTVIRICEKLDLNPLDFSSLEQGNVGARILESRLLDSYGRLNRQGRDRVLELVEDFAQIERYKAQKALDKAVKKGKIRSRRLTGEKDAV